MKRRMLRQENMRSCFKRAVIIITALAAGGTVLYGLWARGTFLPGWIIWEENNITDTSGSYHISLKNKLAQDKIHNCLQQMDENPSFIKRMERNRTNLHAQLLGHGCVFIRGGLVHIVIQPIRI